MREIVPEHTPQITNVLQSMGYSTVHRVPVVQREDCRMNHCWINVPLVIEKDGGEAVPGRIVWIEASGKWLHLEAHCCWRMPDGTLVDPTPKMDKEHEIAFVEEPLKWDGHLIASRYHCFTNDPADTELVDFIRLWQMNMSQMQQAAMCRLNEFNPAAIGKEGCTNRQDRQRVGRNETCPCGSGRKFKKCCGAPM